MDGRVLSIAGSDPSGGAGIQADIKTITALGGYAATALTALTVQNTVAVSDVQVMDPFFVEAQVEAVVLDIGVDAIKIGMLAQSSLVEIVARTIEAHARHVPVVLDPVMVASSGGRLLDEAGRRLLARRLIPLSALVTPNLPEAEMLTGLTVTDEGGMHQAAEALLLMGAGAVLIKGGHLQGNDVVDLLRTADGAERRFESDRLQTRATHGTGCTLSSAIATGLAQGMTLESAVERAIHFVHDAMRSARPLGQGSAGPLDHAFPLRLRPEREALH